MFLMLELYSLEDQGTDMRDSSEFAIRLHNRTNELDDYIDQLGSMIKVGLIGARNLLDVLKVKN